MRDLRSAAIIAVGSELLTPHRIDTNSLYLSGELAELGIRVRVKYVVGDRPDDLAVVLREALGRADVVLLTGGLGPTDDDLTRDVVADVLGRPLVDRPEILATIETRFAQRGLRMPVINRRQARAPEGAVVLPNDRGTAPGLLLESDDRPVILLPGPPRELQPMFTTQVAPRLATRTDGQRLRRRVLKVTGRSESQVEEVANPIYTRLATGAVPVETTILATPGQIELHLSAVGDDVTRLDATLEDGIRRLAAALGDVVFGVDDETLESVVGAGLAARGLTIAAAESCTGGLLLGRLTSVPGSSGWVRGGVVAYANDVKVDALGISDELLRTHGAVSETVARAMAEGARVRLGSSLGVGITGIAGPGGGTDAKPVGTVAIAVAVEATTSRTYRFPGDREAIRRHAVSAALDMVRRTLQRASPDRRNAPGAGL